MRGLDGSLSDNTITSSGDGGCRSFLMTLRGEQEKTENNSQFHHSTITQHCFMYQPKIPVLASTVT